MKLNRILYFTPLTLVFGALFLSGCVKDTISGSSSTFIPVEAKNSSLYFHYSVTTDPQSGTTGYNQFLTDLAAYDDTEVLATITLGDVGGANNDTIYDENTAMFGIVGVPFFQGNLDTFNLAEATAIHNVEPVVANAAYELEFGASEITINTTTEFFQASSNEDFYLTPYLVVDSIVAFQEGHPDAGATNHRKVVVDVGRLNGHPARYLGYKVAGGTIDVGYKFNLQFTCERLPAWTDEDKISVALVLTKRDANGRPIFVNANTNH